MTTRTPQGIEKRHWQPVEGWRRHASPVSLIIFGAVVLAGLIGALGHERDWTSSNRGTRLEVHAPEVIRNGEFLEMRLAVESEEALGDLRIGIGQGLWEDFTVNTMIPAATEESSQGGEFGFAFGELEAGTPFLLKIDLQVNPDILGGNRGLVTVYDGDEPLTQVTVEITVLP